jgi:hypothetical protein
MPVKWKPNRLGTRVITIQNANRASRRHLDEGLLPYEGSADQARHKKGNWNSRKMGKRRSR